MERRKLDSARPARRDLSVRLAALKANPSDGNIAANLRKAALAIDPDAAREVAKTYFNDLDQADEAKRSFAYKWISYARREAQPRLIEIILREHDREDDAILADALSALPGRDLVEGASDQLLKILLKLLSSPNAEVRSGATTRLVAAGVEPARAETEIVKILGRLVGNQRRHANITLERIRLLRAWSDRK